MPKSSATIIDFRRARLRRVGFDAAAAEAQVVDFLMGLPGRRMSRAQMRDIVGRIGDDMVAFLVERLD